MALEQRMEVATRKISELSKLKNNKFVKEVDERVKMEEDNKALTEKVNQRKLALEKCQSDLQLLQEKISVFDTI